MLEDTLHRSFGKIFQIRAGTSEIFGSCHGAADHEHRECDPVSDLMLVGNVMLLVT